MNNAELSAMMNRGAPKGYGITQISGYEIDGTKYYFTTPAYRWDPSMIGELPKQELFDTRELAVAAAVEHSQQHPAPSEDEEADARLQDALRTVLKGED